MFVGQFDYSVLLLRFIWEEIEEFDGDPGVLNGFFNLDVFELI